MNAIIEKFRKKRGFAPTEAKAPERLQEAQEFLSQAVSCHHALEARVGPRARYDEAAGRLASAESRLELVLKEGRDFVYTDLRNVGNIDDRTAHRTRVSFASVRESAEREVIAAHEALDSALAAKDQAEAAAARELCKLADISAAAVPAEDLLKYRAEQADRQVAVAKMAMDMSDGQYREIYTKAHPAKTNNLTSLLATYSSHMSTTEEDRSKQALADAVKTHQLAESARGQVTEEAQILHRVLAALLAAVRDEEAR